MNPTDAILCWALIGPPAIFGLLILVRAARRHVLPNHPHCSKCAYDLTGNRSDRCPECGQDLDSPAALLRSRPFLEQLLMSVILIGLASYGLPIKNRVLNIEETWDTALIPTTALLATLPWITPEKQAIVEGRLLEDEPYHEGWMWQGEWLIRRYGDLIRSDDDARAMSAVYCLRKLAPLHHSALMTMCEAIRVDDPARRRMVAPMLGAVYPEIPYDVDRDTAATSLINTISEEPETWNLLIEVQALEQMGPRAVESAVDPLRALMRHREKTVQSIAFEAMSMLGDRQFQYLADDDLALVLDCFNIEISFTEGHTIHFYGRGAWNSPPPDPYLLEMIRRGGSALEQCLEAHLQVQDAPREEEGDEWFSMPGKAYDTWRSLGQLEVLTALRRVQHQRDPLTVEAQLDGDALAVRLINTDVEFRPLLVQRGGDNRGPRMERFHVEVRNSLGQLVPTQYETDNFGGISSIGELAAGESMSYTLSLADYAHMPTRSGEYTIVVHYHDVLQIADQADVSRFVTSRSDPIAVAIK